MFLRKIALTSFFLIAASPALAQQGDGAQMAQATAQQGQRPNPFDRLDANRDGVITREEVRAVRTQSFNQLDTNRDTFLVREEMMAGRTKMDDRRPGRRPQEPRQEGGRGPLAAADINKDGTISRAEFDAAMNARQVGQTGEPNANRERMFAALDTDRNASLSAAEIAAAQARRGARKGPETQRPMQQGQVGQMRMPDTDNDGKVSLTEWLARPDPLFDRGDANRDGRLTREEAAAVVREGRGPGGRPNRPW